MSLVRWQPWHEVDLFRQQLDQLFDDLTKEPLVKSGSVGKRLPAVELTTTDAALVLKAELPGIEGKDLDIQVTPEAVSLKGEYRQESKQEDENVYRSEFRYGSFYRTIPLPVEVDQTQAKAELKDGILTLTLPKVTPDRNKAVKINLASSTAAPVDAAATEAEAAAV